MKPITKEQAIKALHDLEEVAFGHDKGSGEAYLDWAIDQDLCEYCDEYEGEEWDDEIHAPPSIIELLVAIGVSPQDLVDVLCVNPHMFTPEMCRCYRVDCPK
jgi:hypothetical protein